MHIARDFIKFPESDQELASVSSMFYSKFGFPNIVGAIDGTHIEMRRPATEDFFVFLK